MAQTKSLRVDGDREVRFEGNSSSMLKVGREQHEQSGVAPFAHCQTDPAQKIDFEAKPPSLIEQLDYERRQKDMIVQEFQTQKRDLDTLSNDLKLLLNDKSLLQSKIDELEKASS